MKKLFLILTIIILFTGCEVINEEITAIQEYMDYFIDLEVSSVFGTENTDFIFTVKTNDVIRNWKIDGYEIYKEDLEDNTFIYNFSPGIHTITVTTYNGSWDEVYITVTAVETIFKLSAITGDTTTEIYLDFPVLTISRIDYNLKTTTSLNIIQTEYLRTVTLQITVDQTDSFCFVNNNAWDVHGIDLNNMSIVDMIKIIGIFFPERDVPVIPDFTDTFYSLTGHTGVTSDYLTVFDDRLQLTNTVLLYADYYTYAEGNRYVGLNILIDNQDSFFFINNNMMTFFNIDLSNMSLTELTITVDILNRYPEEGIRDLQEEY